MKYFKSLFSLIVIILLHELLIIVQIPSGKRQETLETFSFEKCGLLHMNFLLRVYLKSSTKDKVCQQYDH